MAKRNLKGGRGAKAKDATSREGTPTPQAKRALSDGAASPELRSVFMTEMRISLTLRNFNAFSLKSGRI